MRFPYALTPFSAKANGEDAQLALLAGNPTPGEITIGLLHFSSYTISDAPTADEITGDGISQMMTTRNHLLAEAANPRGQANG